MDKGLKPVLIIGGIVLATLLIVPAILGAIFGWHDEGWGMMGGNGTMGGFGMIGFMAIFWIAILGFIIWAVVAAAKGTSQPVLVRSDDRHDSVMDILKKKYARGEITRAEFEEKRRDLA